MVSNETLVSNKSLELKANKKKEVTAFRKINDGFQSQITFLAKDFKAERSGMSAMVDTI